MYRHEFEVGEAKEEPQRVAGLYKYRRIVGGAVALDLQSVKELVRGMSYKSVVEFLDTVGQRAKVEFGLKGLQPGIVPCLHKFHQWAERRLFVFQFHDTQVLIQGGFKSLGEEDRRRQAGMQGVQRFKLTEMHECFAIQSPDFKPLDVS